jgi:hypothetical protein
LARGARIRAIDAARQRVVGGAVDRIDRERRDLGGKRLEARLPTGSSEAGRPRAPGSTADV